MTDEQTPEQVAAAAAAAQAERDAAATNELMNTRAERDAAAAQATEATSALLSLTRAANPTIPPEMIDGATPAAIGQSVATAQAIIEKVKAAQPDPAAAAAAAAAPAAAGTKTAPITTATAPGRDTTVIDTTLRGSARIRAGLDALLKKD